MSGKEEAMSIVVEGLGELLAVDLYSLAPSAEARGRAFVRIGVPAGSVTLMHTSPKYEDWVTVLVAAEREDAYVTVGVDVDAPSPQPITLDARWGEDRETIRGPSDGQLTLVLDGLPRRLLKGMLERHGGPEYAPGFIAKDNGD
jgi:hypothetical protein